MLARCWLVLCMALMLSAPASAQGPAPAAVPRAAVAQQRPAQAVVQGAAVVPQYTMPPLIGLTLQAAQARLKDVGLSAPGVQEIAVAQPAGTVVRQSPGARTTVTRFTPITLYVSSGPPQQTPPPPQPAPPELLMPRLVGMTEGQARSRLSALQLREPRVGYRPSESPVGEVLDQRPPVGQPVTTDTPMALIVSRPQVVRVPSVIGQTPPQARSRLGVAGLRLGAEEVRETDGPGGFILQTDPGEGELAPRGSAVRYVVGRQAIKPVPMPDVVRRSLGDADATLAAAGLRRTGTTSVASVEDRGVVVDQDPAAGRPVIAGSPITLALSDGSLTTVPSLIGRTPAAAREALATSHLQAGAETHEASTATRGQIFRTAPSAGAVVARNSPVAFAVAETPTGAVPSVVGKPEAEARRVLEAAGFRAAKESATLGSTVTDRVVRQAPSADTQAPLSSTVTFALAEAAPPSTPSSTTSSAPSGTDDAGGAAQGGAVAQTGAGSGAAGAAAAGAGAGAARGAGHEPPGRGKTQDKLVLPAWLAWNAAPAWGAAAALLAGLGVAGWSTTWPLRVVVRSGVTDLSPPSAEGVELGPGGDMTFAWGLEPEPADYRGELDAAVGAIDLTFEVRLGWRIEPGTFEAEEDAEP